MTPEDLARVTATLRGRSQLYEPYRRAARSMFAQQAEAVLSPSKRKAFCCSRRAGKTNGIALWLYEGGLSDPGGLSLYVGRTQHLARITLLPAYQELQAAYELPFVERSRDNQLQIALPNGHVVWLAGCKNSAEFGKFRGPKFRRVAWDEAQLAGEWLQEAIDDAIDPALSDKDGDLILAGTPGVVPAGYWYQAASGKRSGWEAFNWTCIDNPYWRALQQDQEEYLRRKREENGWSVDHPTYVREWLGLWVQDDNALVFAWDYQRNAGRPDATANVQTVIGVDLGDQSATAWVVVQVVVGRPEVYVVEVYQREQMTPSAVAAYTQQLQQRYPRSQVVVDAGGLGGAYVREMRERHGVHAEAADKRDRRAAIENLRGDIASGTVLVDPVACRELLDEWSVLQWDESHTNFDERFADHLTDACLYAYRRAVPRYRPEEEVDCSADAMARRHKATLQQRLQKAQREEWQKQLRAARKASRRGSPPPFTLPH